MAEDDRDSGNSGLRPASAARSGSGAETGWAVIGTMISGMAVWGGAGWLLDRWLDVRVFTPVGIILGMAASIYLVVARFGGVPPGERRASTTPGRRRSRPGENGQPQKGRR